MRTPDEVESAWLQANLGATKTATVHQDHTAVGGAACLRQAPSPTAGNAPTGDDSDTTDTIINDTNTAT